MVDLRASLPFDQASGTSSPRCVLAPVRAESSCGRLQLFAVVGLLATHAGLLAYSATRHSPTMLEPAFLAAGLSHWQFGRFELYRVNPPLVRMVAALPVLAIGCQTDWSRFHDGPGCRAEFPVGEDFIKANGQSSIPLFFYARWACIPFSLIGGWFAYCWANDLYGHGAGLLTLTLWCFEPNLLAHAELITPDAACTSFGIAAGYCFWRWLKEPSWRRAVFAGVFLGLAELAKMSWLILFGLWPALWLAWLWLAPCSGDGEESADVSGKPCDSVYRSDVAIERFRPSLPAQTRFSVQFAQLAMALLIAVYLLNFGYAFNGSFTRLRDFKFVSRLMTGLDKPGEPGNRFQGGWLGQVPIPVPKDYVLGFDTQKKDFEDFSQPSYLRGEWKHGGWWYYYLYGLLVKVPCGTLVLLGSIGLWSKGRPGFRNLMVLLTPAMCLLILVSSQTAFNHHLRYVFPCIGFALILLGQGVFILTCRFLLMKFTCVILITWSLTSALLVYPHHLAYFNEFSGGSSRGHLHLLGSSFDWGQDLLEVSQWASGHQNCRPVNLLSQTRFNVFHLLNGCCFPEEIAGDVPRLPGAGTLIFSQAMLVGDSWPVAHPLGYCHINVKLLATTLSNMPCNFTRIGATTLAVTIGENPQ